MKKHLYYIIFYLLLTLNSANSPGQQTPRFSQFIMNEFIVNPAVAGFDGQTILSVTGRKEWLGFSTGASTPESFSFTAQTRFLKRKLTVQEGFWGKHVDKSKGKIGLGLNLFADQNGIFRQTGISMAYSYHIQLFRTQLSFGLALSLFQLQLKTDEMKFKDSSHERPEYIRNSTLWIPDLNAGINLWGKHYKIGLAGVQLLQSHYTFDQKFNSNKMKIFYTRNYYLSASFINNISSIPEWEYEPSFMLRVYDFLRFSPQKMTTPKYIADVMLRLIYEQAYWLGAGYRTSNDFIFLLGIKTGKMYFSYSFDYGNNGISDFSWGSHEISISAKFGDIARRYRWMERY